MMNNSKSGGGPTLEFKDNVNIVSESVSPTLDKTRFVASDGASLANIAEREILLTTITYAVASTTVNTINPWHLFFTNKRLINRVNNYRCVMGKKLRLRMCVAATPFAYGRIIAAYVPFGTHDNATKIGTSFNANAIVLSQKYHAEMSITDGETHILELPMLWPEDTIDLQDDMLSELGSLVFYPLSPLAQANGSTASISISVFGSMEGIELHRPTTVNSFYLVNQSRPMIDIPEQVNLSIASPRDVAITCQCCGVPFFAKKVVVRRPSRTIERLPFENQSLPMEKELGTISGTLEEVADIVDKVRDIPIIGKYAETTADAVRGGAKLAQALGYASPEDTRPITRVIPRPVPSLSHASGINDYSKLALDPAQAIDLSAATVGYQDSVGTSLTRICEVETTFSKFTWATSDAVGKCLWNARCTPNLGYWDGATYRYSTAAEFACMNFDKIRYSNCFKFDAVASKMHRGKLLILYDPSYIASVELNVLTGVVLDLGDSGATCVEVRVPWSQPFGFVINQMPAAYNVNNYSTTAYNTKDENFNGVVGVYVLSPLASTNDTSGLSIEVLVKSKVCEPKMFDLNHGKLYNISYINQSRDETKCDIASNDHTLGDIMGVYGGEVHDDIMAICSKPVYNYSNMHDLSNTDSTKYYFVASKCVRMAHPPVRGTLASSGQVLHPDYGTGATNANRIATAGLNYYAPAYAMVKGGVKYIANYSRRGPNADNLTMYVGKAFRTEPLKPTKEVFDYSTPGTNPDWTWNTPAAQGSGSVVNNCGTFGVARINPILAWEVPWQSIYRFKIAREVKPLGSFSAYGMENNNGSPGYRTFLSVPSTGSNTSFATSYVSEDIYTSKGEDYALYWFQGMPAWSLVAT